MTEAHFKIFEKIALWALLLFALYIGFPRAVFEVAEYRPGEGRSPYTNQFNTFSVGRDVREMLGRAKNISEECARSYLVEDLPAVPAENAPRLAKRITLLDDSKALPFQVDLIWQEDVKIKLVRYEFYNSPKTIDNLRVRLFGKEGRLLHDLDVSAEYRLEGIDANKRIWRTAFKNGKGFDGSGDVAVEIAYGYRGEPDTPRLVRIWPPESGCGG